MSKDTFANKLPRKLAHNLKTVGEQIKLARLRRNLSLEQVAERASCSIPTLMNVERGRPTVSIGIILRVLYALQLDDDILLIAKDDDLGRTIQDMGLKNRQRASKKK
jgi:transcriptional regulator with XRE-family HTH domain